MTFRPLQESDLKYLWAHYKKGKTGLPEGLSPEEFKIQIPGLLSKYEYLWTLQTDKPVGVVLGRNIGPLIWIEDILWFPWASRRNILETAVLFFNQMRNVSILTGYAEIKDKGFYEHLCRYSVLRRVGSIHDIYPDQPVAQFQTRK